ncbi:MAG: ABC transporter ATP-binding protein [Bacteroidota bacterium]
MKASTITQAWSMLSLSQKRKGTATVGLLVIQSLLDFFSVASFLPLVFLILRPEFVTTQATLKAVYNFFGFTSSAYFVAAVAGGILLFIISKSIVSLWISRAKAQYVFNIGRDLSNRAFGRYLQLEYPGFSDADHARELNRIANQPLTFANNIILPMATILSEALVFIFIVSCIILYDWKIILILSVILAPCALLFQIMKKGSNNVGLAVKEKYPLSLKYAQQAIEGFIEIKAAGKESFFAQRFKGISEALSRAFVKDHLLQSGTNRLMEVIAAFIVCFLVIYGVLSQQSYQQMILMLSIYAGASFRIIPSINRILYGALQMRTHEYLLAELKDLGNFQPTSTRPKSLLRFKETIELKNISFRYPDGPSVLQHTTLVIHKGEKVAITGKSGEGKTTLLLLLLGFLRDHQGEILVDGNKIETPAIRSLLAYVSQDPYIFDGTVAENIAFGTAEHEIDLKKIETIMRELDLNHMLEQMPGGIQTRIGEKGVKLSGGQRQRLAIARALYADAEILLLDEITNQLHADAEMDVLNLLNELSRKGKTIIKVTHKLGSLGDFDSVYQLKQGKLQKMGVQNPVI